MGEYVLGLIWLSQLLLHSILASPLPFEGAGRKPFPRTVGADIPAPLVWTPQCTVSGWVKEEAFV